MAEYVDVTMVHSPGDPPSLFARTPDGKSVGLVIKNDVDDWGVWEYTIRIQRDDVKEA